MKPDTELKAIMSPKNQLSTAAAYDIQLLFPVLFLVGIGIVMVYSASSALALKKFGSDYLFLKKQALKNLRQAKSMRLDPAMLVLKFGHTRLTIDVMT